MYRLAYTLPVVTTSFLIGPMAVIQGIYAKYFGIPLTTIAAVLLIARVFDAVTDPLIGFYSDRYHARTGSRKPFIVGGGILLVVSSYFLYIPVDLDLLQAINENKAPVTVSPAYFLGWFIAFYFAWTLFEIPHLAWANELVSTTQQKNLIYSQRGAAGWLGILFFYAIPLLPTFETNDFTPYSIAMAVLLVSGLAFVFLWICIRFTPNGKLRHKQTNMLDTYSQSLACRSVVIGKELLGNKPLLLFLLASILSAISISGMWFTLLFIYVDSYLGLGEYFAVGTLISLIIGILMIGLWCWMANRFGKVSTVGLGLLVSSIGIILTGQLTQGESGFFYLVLVMVLCYGMGITALEAISPSLLADIIDYNHWKYGNERDATYFSLRSVSGKIGVAIGGAIGLAIVDGYGFDPAKDIFTAEGIFGFRLAISWLPAGITLCAMLLFLVNPMTARRHAIVRKRLDSRSLRATRSEKVSTLPERDVCNAKS